MTAFRLFSRLNTFYGMTGQLLAGGKLKFYDAGTTTPRNVYGDPGLTINNGTSVQLDSSGRPDVDVWGQGAYFVEVFDSLGVKQGEADNVQVPGDSGQNIPALEAGKFLTNNGAVLLWSGIREVPDPTGQSGKQLGTDGEAIFWEPKLVIPEPPKPDWTTGTNKLQLGDVLLQWGTDTAPASNAKSTVKAATFGTAFAEAPYFVAVTPILGTITPNGSLVCGTATNLATGGFTANFGLADDDNKSWKAINVTVPFRWFAIGKPAA